MSFILIAVLLGIFTFINILAPVSGSATVTPVLTGLVGAKDAVAVATVFFFLTCIPRVVLFRKHIRWELVKQLWPVSIIGALCGGFIFTRVSEKLISVIIFGFLSYFLYQKAVASFSKSEKSDKKPTRHGVIFIGFISGALQGTGLAGSDLRNGYLLSKGLTIPEIHGTTALIGGSNFLFASILRLHSGQLTVAMALPIVLLFPVIVIATYIGRHVTLKLSKQWQNRVALGIMMFALITILHSLLVN